VGQPTAHIYIRAYITRIPTVTHDNSWRHLPDNWNPKQNKNWRWQSQTHVSNAEADATHTNLINHAHMKIAWMPAFISARHQLSTSCTSPKLCVSVLRLSTKRIIIHMMVQFFIQISGQNHNRNKNKNQKNCNPSISLSWPSRASK
jgi:hypothetical protein